MKANPLMTLWIMLRSALTTGRVCCSIIVRASFGKLPRQQATAIARAWAKRVLNIIGVKCRVYNPHHVDFRAKKPLIVMINHSSLYDIPLTFETIDADVRMVAKKELFRIPLFGRAMRCTEIASINRQNREQAIRDLGYAQEKMKSGIVLWVAPEGTRSHDGKLGRLKKGGFVMAIRAQATIVPVGIRNADKILPAKTWHFHLNQPVEVHIGQPIDASDYAIENKEELIEKVSKELAQLADIEAH